jgi:hypothetical protein
MDFRSNIPGTFGDADLKFAGHQFDAERAIELLLICYKADVSMAELLLEVENYLRKRGAGEHHIVVQLNEVKERFSGWLHFKTDFD